jgi:hypothetical protein
MGIVHQILALIIYTFHGVRNMKGYGGLVTVGESLMTGNILFQC